MKYGLFIKNNGLVLTDEKGVILSGIKLRINYIRSMNVTYIPESIEATDNVILVTFKREIERNWMWEAEYVKLIFTEHDGALLTSVDFACRQESFAYNYSYPAYESAFIDYKLPETTTGTLGLHNEVPFWLTPSFDLKVDPFAQVQSLAFKAENRHIQLLPLINETAKSHIKNNSIVINTNKPNITKIKADAFILCSESSPFEAISKLFSAGRALNCIKVTSIEERSYPKEFENFGWCTWNAFYKEVTADKIFSALDMLKSKGVKIKWLLIDDGWQQFEDGKLLSFKEDPQKFPQGFKAFTEKVKNDYGIEYIGVWHAFGGYWDGIHRKGEIYRNHRDLLFETPTGWVFPGETEEKAFKFWDLWHSYLKSQGIDFVKVDNQASTSSKYDNITPGSSASFIQHSALEKSVFKNFGGAIINCMGCDMEDILTRPHSAVDRNSDDFYPKKEHGFIAHINRNVYVSPIHNEINYLDFDMFWTDHDEAVISGVLRALSGGPIYVSDEIGRTKPEALEALVLPDGKTWRMDTAAKITEDLFYTDCSKEGTPIKVWSKSGENIAVAAFGITPYKTVSGEFSLFDIPHNFQRYLVHDFFGGNYFVLDEKSSIPLETDYKTCKLFTLYPIHEDGTVAVGNPNYYAQAADPCPEIKTLDELLK